MKYRIDAYYKSGAVKQGTKLLDNLILIESHY